MLYNEDSTWKPSLTSSTIRKSLTWSLLDPSVARYPSVGDQHRNAWGSSRGYVVLVMGKRSSWRV